MKKMKRFFGWMALSCLFTVASAQVVPMEEAASTARSLFLSQGKTLTRCARVEVRESDTLFYIFNASDAFAVVSADYRTPALLAFSDEVSFSDSEISPAAQMWLDHYARQLQQLRQIPYVEKSKKHPSALVKGNEIAPMLRSKWGQGFQYNYYCPKDVAGEGGRVVTGCVATAMAELMYYFRFPTSGTGSYSYTDETYGVQSADYANAVYDYGAMCNHPTRVNAEISKLMYHCGVGVDMVYGVNGSGMYNHSAADVLKNHFKFSPETRYLFRDSTTLNWDSVIVAHLQRSVPLYYAGWSVPNIDGHAFICDGYQTVDSAYYFHFDFGWDGSSNGYFYTNALNVAGTHFNLAQELIINAYPDTTLYEYPAVQPSTGTMVLTSRSGSFTVGSYGGNVVTSPADYTWIIRPEVENMTSISLQTNVKIMEGDTLFVTAGSPSISPMSLTGDTNFTVAWNCSEITCRFVSSASETESFLDVSYVANSPLFCSGTPLTTATSGTITDGSGESDYDPMTYCGFKIKVLGYPAVRVTFHEFDLEEDHDFLHVYRYQGTTNYYLTSLTGTFEPGTEMTFESGRLLFVFESDEENEAAGFNFDFVGTTEISVADVEAVAVSVYPNPASESVSVEWNSPQLPSEYQIVDVCGRTQSVYKVTESTTELDLSELPKGIYLLRVISDGKCVAVRKVVRQ